MTYATPAAKHRPLTYGPLARTLHWLMVALILLQAAMGLIMVYEAPEPNMWVTLAKSLKFYDVHKSLGLVLLALAVIRIANRILVGAPPEVGLETWQRETSNFVHSWIYFLLLAVPLLGWIGIQLYPAVVVFESFSLPSVLRPDQKLSESVFVAHRWAALTLLALIAMHFGAAMYHRFIRRDAVFGRMWPAGRPEVM